MFIEDLLAKRKMTKYQLEVTTGMSHMTLTDIYYGKAKLEDCPAETIDKLAGALGVSKEMLIESGRREMKREKTYESGLPEYLQHDLDAYKEGLRTKSNILDCLWGELYGSINMAEISDGVITSEHADYLRQKYLWKGTNT